MIRSLLPACLLAALLAPALPAQERAPAARPASPRVTELTPTHTYQIVFARGDEIASKLAEFAEKNNIKIAHFDAVGAFSDVVLGWYNLDKREHDPIPLKEEMEIVSFSGNITRDRNNKPVVHAHCVVALKDGSTRGGHFTEGHISLTMQMYLTSYDPLPATTQSASR